jgi:hypothetical protein
MLTVKYFHPKRRVDIDMHILRGPPVLFHRSKHTSAFIFLICYFTVQNHSYK